MSYLDIVLIVPEALIPITKHFFGSTGRNKESFDNTVTDPNYEGVYLTGLHLSENSIPLLYALSSGQFTPQGVPVWDSEGIVDNEKVMEAVSHVVVYQQNEEISLSEFYAGNADKVVIVPNRRPLRVAAELNLKKIVEQENE